MTFAKSLAKAWGVIALAVFAFTAPAFAKVLPVSAYSQLEDIRSVRISPNGEKLAMIAGKTREDFSVLIITLDGSEGPMAIGTEGDRPLSVTWVSDDYIAVMLRKYSRVRGTRARGQASRMVFVSIDGKNVNELQDGGSILSRKWDDPDTILTLSSAVSRGTSSRRSEARGFVAIREVELKSGQSKVVERFSDDTADVLTDSEGKPYARITAEFPRNTTNYFLYFRVEVPDGRSWRTIYELTDEPRPNGGYPINFTGLSNDKTKAYFIREYEADPQAKLYAMDLNDGSVEPVVAAPGVDVYSLGEDPYTGKFLGVRWYGDVQYARYFDNELQSINDQLQAALPGSVISIQSWSRDRSKFILNVQGGSVAKAYLLYDRPTGSISVISQAYPDVPANEVAPVEYITYTARDGLEIPAYVTYPVNRARKDLPMVMLPHGGPEARDYPGFDWWSQVLANRGYVVMQPQFRGSDGFGSDFIEAGWKKWGREMQTDLTDGVRYLVDQGVVDADRVCIFGWSYGGYAAAAGITIDPDTYRCSVAGAAVTDLREMLLWEGAARTSGQNASADYWQTAIGDLRDDKGSLERYSPAKQVDNIGGPIMLIHGDKDLTVPIEQAEIMVRALKAANKEYEYVVLEDEDHQILFGATRAQMGQAMVDFITKHNPPN